MQTIRAFASMPAPSFACKVSSLKRPETYGIAPADIEAIETHFAWVFLTPRYAYKIKKPVRLDQLDNTTLDARRRNCEEELRLNRRLAPAVYLEVTTLNVDARGALAVAGPGQIVEWLVKMRRLPRGMFLDRCIAEHRVPADALERVGAVLARFYEAQRSAGVNGNQYLVRLAAQMERNQRGLLDSCLQVPAALVRQAFEPQWVFMRTQGALLAARADTGRVVEGHGDLKPEHLFLGEPACVIDCLEFDRDLRIVDCAAEMCALELECERMGAEEVGRALLDTYVRLVADDIPDVLRSFYKRRRATERALTSAWHLLDGPRSHEKNWRNIAIACLHRAAACDAEA